MKWSDWLEKWGMTKLKIKAPFLEMEWEPTDKDKSAAWDLYIELITRVATQRLGNNLGDDKAALTSVHSLFDTTRAVIKDNGRGCMEFTKIAIVMLNQVIRPFTTKWHKRLNDPDSSQQSDEEFRTELEILRTNLLTYAKMLSEMAGVEDITDIN